MVILIHHNSVSYVHADVQLFVLWPKREFRIIINAVHKGTFHFDVCIRIKATIARIKADAATVCSEILAYELLCICEFLCVNVSRIRSGFACHGEPP